MNESTEQSGRVVAQFAMVTFLSPSPAADVKQGGSLRARFERVSCNGEPVPDTPSPRCGTGGSATKSNGIVHTLPFWDEGGRAGSARRAIASGTSPPRQLWRSQRH